MPKKTVFEVPPELDWTKPILEALSLPGESIEETAQRIYMEGLEKTKKAPLNPLFLY